MKDCYRILGVSRHASPGEIRAAFLARMKVCHPDARGAGGEDEAGEVSQAYWQLRDAHRREEHDRLLFGPIRAPRPPKPRRNIRKRPAAAVSLRKRPGKQRKPAAKPATVTIRRKPRRREGRRLQPLRAAAGVAACSISIIGFALAASHFGTAGAPEAQAASALPAAAPPPQERRRLDATLAVAAAGEFRTVVARSGLAGAHLYVRQCLMEFSAHPTIRMLDYCVAFDDEASAWEGRVNKDGQQQVYFAPGQRFGRYVHAARGVAPGPVRESIMADVSYFASERD